MKKHYLLLFLLLIQISPKVLAQEIKTFTRQDFDLRGNVKICQVITPYGQEVFEFDVLGRLIKTTTQYNKQDKDITAYKFEAGHLVEKRLESYKDNVLDLASSMAHFYALDTTANMLIKEQIISYDKEFVELQEYQYNEAGVLEKIMVSHENAVDELQLEHTAYKNEETKTYFENGVLQKSIRKSIRKGKDGADLDVVLTKFYLDGEPNKAIEAITNKLGLLLSEEVFLYDVADKVFASAEKHSYSYDAQGVLAKEEIKMGNTTAVKEYIFKFDNHPEPNWVKKIVTPENTFTSRKITYYPKAIVGMAIEE